jgi:hypothetical protein
MRNYSITASLFLFFAFLFDLITSLNLKNGPEWLTPNNCDENDNFDINLIIPSNGIDIPRSKNNKWEKYGLGDSAFLFDYLDAVLQSPVSKKFEETYQYATKIKGNMKDPYTLDNIKRYYGRDFEAVFPNFKSSEWEGFISLPQVVEIIRTWKWYSLSSRNFIKESFDDFDFNGDGRLDKREFILFSIIHNKNLENTKECSNCYDDIFETFIYPMFTFLDCDKDRWISSEDIWNGLKKLKRNSPAYSLYNCHLVLKQIEKYPRTISINDFILLNSENIKSGKIDRKQFRTGILLGYWQRQVDTNKIYFKDSELDAINKKEKRWGENGFKDYHCEDFLSMVDF